MSDIDTGHVGIVEKAAKEGGKRAMEWFRTEIDSENKAESSAEIINPADVVTDADRAAQRKVIDVIKEEYPDDAIVGEEEDELKSVPKTGTAWVIDPIDGTYNFARGGRDWATSVAVVRDGNPIAAANFLPALGDMYVASSGEMTRNGTRVAVSDRPEPKYSSVAPMVIPDYGDREGFGNATKEIVTNFGNIRRYGSAQVTCALVASGVLEGAVTHRKLNPWDSIAGAYMIEEAGGKITDIDGEKWTHESQGLVASNGRSHDEILAVARTMAGNK